MGSITKREGQIAMTEQRDGTGTGTGVWTHQAAETGQPEQRRCECGACVFEAGPMAWYWQPMQEKLLAALCNMVEMAWFPGCPGELEWPCPCGATGTEDVACERDPHLCALEWAGLTESEAAALWKRMKEAASK